MFDHLDDDRTFRPDDAFRARAVARGRSRRRHRRLATGGALAVVLLAGSAVAALAYVDRKVDAIDRVDVAGLTPERGHDAAEPRAPRTLLFVGIDRDVSIDRGEGVVGTRSDTIVLARIDPDRNVVSVLPLPRDLWVDVPGHGRGRINATLALGGPSLLVDTIRTDLGIAIDTYVETDFAGAVAIGDAVGGIRLRAANPLRDARSGLDVPTAGCTTFDGRAALQLARSRHLEALVDGRWRRDPLSDLGRIDRGQDIAAALFARLTDLDANDPAELKRLLDSAADHLTIDSGTTRADLEALVRGIAGADAVQLRIPVVDEEHGGAQVLARAEGTDAVVAAFGRGALAPVAPGVPSGPSDTTSTTGPAGGGPAPDPFALTPC